MRGKGLAARGRSVRGVVRLGARPKPSLAANAASGKRIRCGDGMRSAVGSDRALPVATPPPFAYIPGPRLRVHAEGRGARALSSAGEHFLDMEGVTGSIPVALTTFAAMLRFDVQAHSFAA